MPTHRYPGMVAGAAGNEDKSPTPLDLFDVVLQSTQDHWKAKRTANPSFCSTIFHLIKKGPQRAHESAEKECFNKTTTDKLLLHFFFYMHVALSHLPKHKVYKQQILLCSYELSFSEILNWRHVFEQNAWRARVENSA